MNDVIKAMLEQIGGRQTFMMVGASNASYDNQKNSLTFKFGRAPKTKANYVRIEYVAATDLYRVTFIRIYGHTYTETSVHNDIYADGLRGLFERETGLRTSLTAVYA